MSLRVVHVIGGLELGGAETLLYRVASHPLPGVEQHVICLGKPDWYSSRLTEKGVEVHHLGMDSPLTALGRIRRLGAVLRRMRPDVIQSWMYLSNLLSSLVARRCRTPVVWGIHNSSLERVGLASRLCVYAGGRGARRLASFVVNCSSHSAELHAELGYSAGANAVIANGYDPSVFGPEPHARAFTRCNLGLGDETFVVGSIARWHPDKDIPTLLRAARIAADEGVPLRCLLVGRGLGPDDQELATAIRAVGCQDVMAALGERSDIPNLARAFDLHVLSSRSEAFPNVIAETMLSGTPNVATDAGDSAAIIGDEGWVVPPASPRRLADAIVEAYEEWSRRPADWSGRGEACRQRIVDNYAFEKMANAYADVWRRVATKSA